MKTKTDLIVVQAQDMEVTINPEAVYRGALARIEKKDARAFRNSPLLVAIAKAIGYGSAAVDATLKAFEVGVTTRIGDAVAYLDEVGGALTPAGKAHGIVANAVFATCKPAYLTGRQSAIWGRQSDGTLLISKEGLCEFLTDLAQTEFEVGGAVQTGGSILGDVFANAGTAESNMWSTLIALATAGTLNETAMTATVATLHTETARFTALPAPAIAATERYRTRRPAGRAGAPASA